MKLKKFEVKSGGRFSPDAPVLIDFSKSNWVRASGDNGSGKTTLLELFLVGCGKLSGQKIVDKLANVDSGKIDIEFEFVGNDKRQYQVKVTKSKFTLLYDGNEQNEPLSKMKQLLGVVGVSPLAIKNSPLRDIIKWLAAYSNKNPEEVEAKLLKIKDGIKQATAARAAANNSAKGLREYLVNEEMFVNWEQAEKNHSKAVDLKAISARLEEAGKKSDKYIQAETKLMSLNARQTQLEAQISALQKELQEVERNIETGNKWLSDNAAAKKEYDEVKKLYDGAAKSQVDYQKWQDIKKKIVEMDDFDSIAIAADVQEKNLIEERKQLQIEILPDLKGLTIVPEDTYENNKLIKEGLYRNGISAAQMSQTEWFKIFLEMFRKNKGRILVIDSYSDLGSSAEEMLRLLAKDGCYIFVAEMDREKKELTIEGVEY